MILKTDYHFNCTLINVVDGDTIDLMIDQGFHTFRKERFRLKNINCPEHNTPDGPKATAYTTAWFKDKIARVETFKPDKYGRWLGVVYDEQNNCLNDDLIKNGLAVPYMVYR